MTTTSDRSTARQRYAGSKLREFPVKTANALPKAQPGARVKGTIVRIYVDEPQTERGTFEPKMHKTTGEPLLQDLVDVKIPGKVTAVDDKTRRFYIASVSFKGAVGQALEDAGVDDLEVGGELEVYIPEFGVTKAGDEFKKYEATYTPPSTGTALKGNVPAQVATPVAATAVEDDEDDDPLA